MKDNDKNVLMPYQKYLRLAKSRDTEEEPMQVSDPGETKPKVLPKVPALPKTDSIPSEEQAIARAFLAYLQLINTDWDWNENGELRINGKTVNGSDVTKLLMYMRGKGTSVPKGWTKFRALFQQEQLLQGRNWKERERYQPGHQPPQLAKTKKPSKSKQGIPHRPDVPIARPPPPPPPAMFMKRLKATTESKKKRAQKWGTLK